MLCTKMWVSFYQDKFRSLSAWTTTPYSHKFYNNKWLFLHFLSFVNGINYAISPYQLEGPTKLGIYLIQMS